MRWAIKIIRNKIGVSPVVLNRKWPTQNGHQPAWTYAAKRLRSGLLPPCGPATFSPRHPLLGGRIDFARMASEAEFEPTPSFKPMMFIALVEKQEFWLSVL